MKQAIVVILIHRGHNFLSNGLVDSLVCQLLKPTSITTHCLERLQEKKVLLRATHKIYLLNNQ